MTSDDWYAELKAKTSLDIYTGDLHPTLHRALRRRAARDGLGLSVRLDTRSGQDGVYTVSLFKKGHRGPGREAYLDRINRWNFQYTIIVAFSSDDGAHLWSQSKRARTELAAIDRVLGEVRKAGGTPIEYVVIPGTVKTSVQEVLPT